MPTINLAQIDLNASTQTRVATDAQVISDYSLTLEMADQAGQPWPFPAVTVFEDSNGDYYIGDGFHRLSAAVAIDYDKAVPAEIRAGGVKDAFRHALGANADHGKRRTAADVRRQISMACLEWPMYSDRTIAEIVKTSQKNVSNNRPAETKNLPRLGQDGKEYNLTPLNQPTTASPKESSAVAESTRAALTVELDNCPTAGEVYPWVDPIPTYRSLIENSGIKKISEINADGELVEHAQLDLIREWCKMLVDGEPRWPGFRPKPISMEHAIREREKYKREQRQKSETKKLHQLREEIGNSYDESIPFAHTLIKQTAKSIPRDSIEFTAASLGVSLDTYHARISAGTLPPVELLILLISTEVLEYGFDWVKENCL